MKPSLSLLLALAAAHPPVDVLVNDTDVLSAAAAAVDAMSADATAQVVEWHVLSARRQLVSGFNYFLVLAMAADRSEPFVAWTLCSATVYTDFAGAVSPEQTAYGSVHSPLETTSATSPLTRLRIQRVV